jgi:hypothetical protein
MDIKSVITLAWALLWLRGRKQAKNKRIPGSCPGPENFKAFQAELKIETSPVRESSKKFYNKLKPPLAGFSLKVLAGPP